MRLSRRSPHWQLIALFLIMFFAARTAGAAVHNVSNQAEFQQALDTSESNDQADTIIVSAGTIVLTAPLEYVADNSEVFPLTVQGAGPDLTILDGNSTYRVLSLDSRAVGVNAGPTLSVSGIGFHNGFATLPLNDLDGGGLLLQAIAAPITVQNCKFVNNKADDDGGGLSATTDVGPNGTVLVEDSVFTGNKAGEPMISSSQGGGTKLGADGSEVILRNNVFSANRSWVDGAGAMISETTNATVVGNAFAQNVTHPTANVAPFFGEGGGLAVEAMGFVEVRDNTFIGNLAKDGGGANLDDFADAIVINNVFLNNQASWDPFNIGSDGDGGGLLTKADPGLTLSLVIANNTLYGNSGLRGGGLSFAQNTDTVATVLNNIIWGNTAPDGADIFVQDDADGDDIGGLSYIDYNDFSSLFIVCDFFINPCTSTNYIIGPNNMDVDPLLVDPANGDAHLHDTSPAIDRGTSLVASLSGAPAIRDVDIDGETRIQDGAGPDNAIIDMGAHEVPGPGILLTMSNVGGSPAPDVGLFRKDTDGVFRAHLYDGATGNLIRILDFETDMVTGAVVVERPGDWPVIAAMQQRPDNSVLVLVKSARNGFTIRRLTYGNAYSGTDLAGGDIDGDGSVEVGVVGDNLIAGRNRILFKNVASGLQAVKMFQGRNIRPLELHMIPTINSGIFPEAGVHGEVRASGATRMRVQDPVVNVLANVNFGSAYTSAATTIIPDAIGAGFSTIAQLGVLPFNGRIRVDTRLAVNGALITRSFIPANQTAIDLAPVVQVPAVGPPVTNVAALVETPGGKGRVYVFSAVNGTQVGAAIGMVTVDSPRALAASKDINGNGGDEVVVLGERNGVERIVIYDSQDQLNPLLNVIPVSQFP